MKSLNGDTFRAAKPADDHRLTADDDGDSTTIK
jgi:hypothetical protein